MLGALALGLGAIGVVLPILPTTPFILLAAFSFAKSSERWHRWLINHDLFGPLIKDWQAHGAINSRAKIAGVLSMAAVLALSLVLKVSTLVLAIQATVLTAAAAFVLSRPSPPDGQQQEHR